MPQVEARLGYTAILTDKEFRLVTLGLAGKLEDEEDINDALKLNTQLCHQRLLIVKQAKEVAAKALENASALETPDLPPYKG